MAVISKSTRRVRRHTLVLSVARRRRRTSTGSSRYTTINDGGVEHVNKSGIAYSTTINDGGVLILLMDSTHYATVSGTTVNKGGLLNIIDGDAGTTTINDGGLVTVIAGTINNVTINSGGTFTQRGTGSAGAGSHLAMWLMASVA